MEALRRKKKYGHAMPLRAMEDAARNEATAVHTERIQGLHKGQVAHTDKV
jgi:hypothetical protein